MWLTIYVAIYIILKGGGEMVALHQYNEYSYKGLRNKRQKCFCQRTETFHLDFPSVGFRNGEDKIFLHGHTVV